MALKKSKNKSGKTVWGIDYYVGKKRRYKAIGECDKRTAERYYNKFMSDLRDKKFGIVEPKKVILKDFVEDYLVDAATQNEASTIERVNQVLLNFLSAFGSYYLLDIDKSDIRSYRHKRLKEVSKETVNLEYRHLKAMFNWALEYNYLLSSPFKGIKALSTPESVFRRFLEIEDIEKVRETFKDDDFQYLVEFYLLTGARLKEPLALFWDNVDFKRHIITIRSFHTKAKKNRVISFKYDERMKKLLASIPKRDDHLLFGPEDGKQQWSAWWVSRKISLKLTEAGLKWASCHTFRHTYVSHLIMSGVPLHTVQKLVGHGSFITTLKYAHLAPKHLEEMQIKRPY